MLERLKAVPGVVDATSAGPIPLDGGNSLARFGPLEAATDPAKFQQAIAYFVQPNYFAFAKTPIVAGRAFSDADNRPEARVIIIDELIAAQLFPNGNADRPAHARARHHQRGRALRSDRRRQASAPHDDDERR